MTSPSLQNGRGIKPDLVLDEALNRSTLKITDFNTAILFILFLFLSYLFAFAP
jgi:hypothetical protein